MAESRAPNINKPLKDGDKLDDSANESYTDEVVLSTSITACTVPPSPGKTPMIELVTVTQLRDANGNVFTEIAQ